MKHCILGLREECNNCGACEDRCQLDPTKVCDNCFRCIDTDNDPAYATIAIEDVLFEVEGEDEYDYDETAPHDFGVSDEDSDD